MSEYHKIETLYVRDEKTFKVDPSQLKNRTYSLIKAWQFTEKIDGTNIRCIWKNGTLSFGGKTIRRNKMTNAQREDFKELIYGWICDIQDGDEPLDMWISDTLAARMADAACSVLEESRLTQAWLKREGYMKQG